MKKSELKEMIRQAMLEEGQPIPPHLYMSNPDGRMDSPKRMINRYLGNLGVDYVNNPLATNNKHYVEGVRNIEVMMSDGRYEEADQYAGEIADKISMLPTLEENEVKESIKGMADDGSIDTELEDALGNLVVSKDQAMDVIDYIAREWGIGIEFLGEPVNEAKEDEEEEEEKVEDEDIEIEDIEGIEDTEEIEDIPSSDASGITGDEKEVQDSLESALIAAKKLGDEKLINQIGNSITFFTRSHVVGSGEENLEEDIQEDNDNTQMSKTIDSLSQMLTPVDSVEGVIQWLLDNPDDIPAEVDEDFFYDNLDQIREKLLQIDLDSTIGETYEKNRMLKIAGLK